VTARYRVIAGLPPVPAYGVAAAALLACTVVLSTVGSVVAVGPDVVPDPAEGGWQLAVHGDASARQGSDGRVYLQTRAPRARATAWYRVTPTHPSAAWEAEARVHVPGPGQRAKIVVASTDPADPLWFGSYRIRSEKWGTVPLSVRGSLQGQEVQVGLLLVGEGGEATLERLDMVPVRRRVSWVVALVGLAVGWLGVALAASRHLGRLPVAVAAVLAMGVVTPRPWLDRGFSLAADQLALAPGARLVLQKGLGHVGVFALLAALLCGRLGPRGALAVVVALGVATEASQLLAISRSASPLDVGLDTLGGLLGIMVWWAARRTTPESPD